MLSHESDGPGLTSAVMASIGNIEGLEGPPGPAQPIAHPGKMAGRSEETKVADHRKVDIALEVRPTFPQTAAETEDSLGRGDAPFNAGPNRRSCWYTQLERTISPIFKPPFLAKATSRAPWPWAHCRLSALAKPPSKLAWRG